MKQNNFNYFDEISNDIIEKQLNIDLDKLEELDLELKDIEKKLHPIDIDFKELDLDFELEGLNIDYEELDRITEETQKELDAILDPVEL